LIFFFRKLSEVSCSLSSQQSSQINPAGHFKNQEPLMIPDKYFRLNIILHLQHQTCRN